MRSRAIHRTDWKPQGQTVAERPLNFRTNFQSSLCDEGRYSTRFRGLESPGQGGSVKTVAGFERRTESAARFWTAVPTRRDRISTAGAISKAAEGCRSPRRFAQFNGREFFYGYGIFGTAPVRRASLRDGHWAKVSPFPKWLNPPASAFAPQVSFSSPQPAPERGPKAKRLITHGFVVAGRIGIFESGVRLRGRTNLNYYLTFLMDYDIQPHRRRWLGGKICFRQNF
jgi:hypothetical protein